MAGVNDKVVALAKAKSGEFNNKIDMLTQRVRDKKKTT